MFVNFQKITISHLYISTNGRYFSIHFEQEPLYTAEEEAPIKVRF